MKNHNQEVLHIFIGFDEVETEAFHVLCQSILHRSSIPVAFHPVKKSFYDFYTRPRDPKQSNEFSFTRFLVPYLMNYEGWALFMDCDMMLRTDINQLFELRDPLKAVMCCKHDYMPSSEKKYLGNDQHPYPRKNWSSVMLFNCSHHFCRTLTPEYINTAPALDLHRFNWAEDYAIGELPLGWNFLVGEYLVKEFKEPINNIHWTIGGPWFDEYKDTDFAEEWYIERSFARYTKQLEIK